MILEMKSDGQLRAHLDLVGVEICGRPNPRQQEQVWGAVATSRQDHLTIRLDLLDGTTAYHLDADGPLLVEQNASREACRDDREIGPLLGWMQIGDGRAASQAITLGDLMIADTVLLGPVEVGIRLETGVFRSSEERFCDRVLRPTLARRERAEIAVKLVLAPLVALGLDEVREHVVVTPTRGSVRGPVVEVGAVAPDVDHGIHRAGAAEHAPAREIDAAIVELRLRLRNKIPIVLGLEELREGGGCVDLRRVVRATRLD